MKLIVIWHSNNVFLLFFLINWWTKLFICSIFYHTMSWAKWKIVKQFFSGTRRWKIGGFNKLTRRKLATVLKSRKVVIFSINSSGKSRRLQLRVVTGSGNDDGDDEDDDAWTFCVAWLWCVWCLRDDPGSTDSLTLPELLPLPMLLDWRVDTILICSFFFLSFFNVYM